MVNGSADCYGWALFLNTEVLPTFSGTTLVMGHNEMGYSPSTTHVLALVSALCSSEAGSNEAQTSEDRNTSIGKGEGG